MNKEKFSVVFEKVKAFCKDKNRMLIVALVAAVGLSAVGYAMTVDKFTDYNPPSILAITWGDYLKPHPDSSYTDNNAVSDRPRWSAAYPYRAIFFGAKYTGSGMQSQRHDGVFYVIFSKNPTTDLFTFEYIAGDRRLDSRKRGYIRAYFNYGAFYDAYSKGDIDIRYSPSQGGVPAGTAPLIPTDYGGVSWGALGYLWQNGYYNGTNNCYFEFDFYYECAAEHQQNAYTLNVKGLRSAASVPYGYILKCADHGTPGGSTSGSTSSEGGGDPSSGGGGDPSSGGGSSGGGSSSGGGGKVRPDHELSVPDDWTSSTGGGSNPDKYPWEDDKNIPDLDWTITPDSGGMVEGESNTGETGGTWEIPDFDIPIDLPFTDDDITIPPPPSFNFPSVPTPDFDFPAVPEFDPDYIYGWPPPCPVG